MAFKRPESNGNSGGVEVSKLGRGKFKARLVAVADLGKFQDTYMGELKNPTNKMALCIEVPGNYVDFGDGKQPRRLWTRPFNFYNSLTEKGNELKFYQAFDEFAEDGLVPDWAAQLGKGVYIIVKETEKDGKVYDTLDSLVAMDEEVAANMPEAETPFIIDAVEDNKQLEEMLFGLAKYQYDQPHYTDGKPQSGSDKPQNGDFDNFDDDIPY